jgi:hypothetical protein
MGYASRTGTRPYLLGWSPLLVWAGIAIPLVYLTGSKP